MGIVDDLLANPGIYLGIDREAGRGGDSAAKVVITPLPGGAGVTLDYETFNPTNPERLRGHAEHALIGRTHGGGTILVTGHIHGDSVTVLRESEPGVFVMSNEPSAFPVAITISVPEPGRLVHSWSYGAPGEEPTERDRAELTRSD
ncbi:MAG: hypothetical protein QOG64_1369 [Acidimicrobiaceae bacterium]|nr:hypothetical protein [Acidimicrobiaceae bacterium]